MFNRTVQASYPPGSVFKLVNGLIGLQEGVLQPWYQYPCSHGYAYTGSLYHGDIILTKIRHSLGMNAQSPIDIIILF